jgi:hypothetical protein
MWSPFAAIEAFAEAQRKPRCAGLPYISDRPKAITDVRRQRSAARGLKCTLAVMRLRNAGSQTLAIVCVSLVIAAADRAEDPGAVARDPRAGAECVEEKARSRPVLAELPGGALDSDETAALLAGDRCARSFGRDHQRQCGDYSD